MKYIAILASGSNFKYKCCWLYRIPCSEALSIQGGINRLYDWYIFSSLRKEVNMIRIPRFVMRK